MKELGNGFDRCPRMYFDCVSHGWTPDCDGDGGGESQQNDVHKLCANWKHLRAQARGAGRNLFVGGTPTGCTSHYTKVLRRRRFIVVPQVPVLELLHTISLEIRPRTTTDAFARQSM